MNISATFDEIIKKEYISFRIQTTKEFLTFRYRLKVDAQLKDNKLGFYLIGFMAPKGDLSNPGYAEYEYKLYDFKYETYAVQIERKDTGKIKFNLKIKNSRSKPLELSGIPRDRFIDIKA
jgi:hypothetical protein